MTEPGAVGDEWVYIVTDIEVDGPWPGPNSMRSLASVAVTADGREQGTFEAVLEPLPGAAPNPDTLVWFRTQPGAWEAATTGPRPVTEVITSYVAWVRSLPGAPIFAALPLSFDGGWVDYYLRRFTAYGLVQGPYEKDVLFRRPALCLASYASAILGKPMGDFAPTELPADWLGGIPHSHRAIDDARGYAHLLGVLFGRAAAQRAGPGRRMSSAQGSTRPE